MTNHKETAVKFDHLESPINYQQDPTLLFHHLCENKPATLLLESAEITLKTNLQSLLIVDSALRIRAFGQQVEIEALSENGAALLPLIADLLASHSKNINITPRQLIVIFPQPAPELDEDNRLKAHSSMDVLRLLPELAQQKIR